MNVYEETLSGSVHKYLMLTCVKCFYIYFHVCVDWIKMQWLQQTCKHWLSKKNMNPTLRSKVRVETTIRCWTNWSRAAACWLHLYNTLIQSEQFSSDSHSQQWLWASHAWRDKTRQGDKKLCSCFASHSLKSKLNIWVISEVDNSKKKSLNYL